MEDLPSAITSQTAMVYTTLRDERLERTLKITKPAGVPVLVDDAAGIPPFQLVQRITQKLASTCIASAAEKDCLARNVLECYWAART